MCKTCARQRIQIVTLHIISRCITGWPRPIGCLRLQVIFCKRATNYRALLRKWPMKIMHPMRLRCPVQTRRFWRNEWYCCWNPANEALREEQQSPWRFFRVKILAVLVLLCAVSGGSAYYCTSKNKQERDEALLASQNNAWVCKYIYIYIHIHL